MYKCQQCASSDSFKVREIIEGEIRGLDVVEGANFTVVDIWDSSTERQEVMCNTCGALQSIPDLYFSYIREARIVPKPERK